MVVVGVLEARIEDRGSRWEEPSGVVVVVVVVDVDVDVDRRQAQPQDLNSYRQIQILQHQTIPAKQKAAAAVECRARGL
jgi:hypothetical protein